MASNIVSFVMCISIKYFTKKNLTIKFYFELKYRIKKTVNILFFFFRFIFLFFKFHVFTNIKAVIVGLSLDEFQIKVNELFREIEFGNNRLFINDLITQNNLRVVPKGIKAHNFVQLFLYHL